MNRYVLSSILLSGAIAACDEGAPESEFTGPGIAITVAPLNLTNISNACYEILIENAALGAAGVGVRGGANDVLLLPSVCSADYGNIQGGDITYIAPCDASFTTDIGPQDGRQNSSVTVWPTLVGPAEGSWVNPCNTDADADIEGCQIFVDCRPNADTFVEFNFTIMRDAQQGFFDVAVNFEDVFCSAKLDSCYANGAVATTCADANKINLLHNATGTTRQHTAVAAFACTAGPGKESALLIGKPSVTCGTTTFALDLSKDGNDTVTVDGKTLRYAVYKGKELLTCDDASTQGTVESCGKVYLNYAINIGDLRDPAGNNLQACTLNQYVATARDKAGSDPGFGPGVFTSHPVIQYGDVGGTALVTGGVTQGFAFPLNVTGSKVTTQYKSAKFWNSTADYFTYAP
ncbi:MAG TPA: hypothetical protein PK095_05675 [Myxococcota bacterium]|nr:hypothetical protein [Myxococcota bacterium]